VTAHRGLQARRSLEPVAGGLRAARRGDGESTALDKRADPKTGGSATRRSAQAALVGFERTAEAFELAYRLGFSFGLQLVGIVDKAIHQGVSKSRIAEGRMP